MLDIDSLRVSDQRTDQIAIFSWKVQYTYLKTGVCYTFDPTVLPEYRECKEPWKYELSVR